MLAYQESALVVVSDIDRIPTKAEAVLAFVQDRGFADVDDAAAHEGLDTPSTLVPCWLTSYPPMALEPIADITARLMALSVPPEFVDRHVRQLLKARQRLPAEPRKRLPTIAELWRSSLDKHTERMRAEKMRRQEEAKAKRETAKAEARERSNKTARAWQIREETLRRRRERQRARRARERLARHGDVPAR